MRSAIWWSRGALAAPAACTRNYAATNRGIGRDRPPASTSSMLEAFRRFRDRLHEGYRRLLPAWHAFRAARAERRAVQWLVDNALIDDQAAARALTDYPDPELP